MNEKKIQTALISVFHKEGLEPIIRLLDEQGVKIISTGGTAKFIEEQGIEVQNVESITGYPSILGGRVKTLHPKVFGGLLGRSEEEQDVAEMEEYDIPAIDLVIVDLYPFEDTLRNTSEEAEIIEKIDIGGIALIRGAAKNFIDTMVVPAREYYGDFYSLLEKNEGTTTVADRKRFATAAFHISSHYDTAIFNYFNRDADFELFKESYGHGRELRYGENPHQKASFYGKLDDVFHQLHGKAISYNNLVDIDAALDIIDEFDVSQGKVTYTVLKHTNPCGLASRDTSLEAWKAALAGDPVSAFGGIIATNGKVDKETAEEINKIFIEVIIAPEYDDDALDVLQSKKNRIILKKNPTAVSHEQFKSLLNGVLVQDKDRSAETVADFEYPTKKKPTDQEAADLAFAIKAVKHLKSNAIALVKNEQLIGMGCGQTSRIDALNQAVEKAKKFEFELEGAVLSSDAFFPFDDSVEAADKAGIKAVVQPGGSKRDQDSIDYCDAHDMAMVFTGVRHFKH